VDECKPLPTGCSSGTAVMMYQWKLIAGPGLAATDMGETDLYFLYLLAGTLAPTSSSDTDGLYTFEVGVWDAAAPDAKAYQTVKVAITAGAYTRPLLSST
jgi:hypothetical protein